MRASEKQRAPDQLDRVLLDLGPQDPWTVRDACAGTLIFGDTGSGKTSGSGQAIARSMLRSGFGGLVLTVKSSETDRWRHYIESCGRGDDLVVFSPESDHGFNFLYYEQGRSSRGGGQTENIIDLFVESMSVSSDGESRTSHDPFWDRALRQILRNTVDALHLAGESISIRSIQDFVLSAPKSADEARDQEWQSTSTACSALRQAELRLHGDVVRMQTLKTTIHFWFHEFAEVMDPRTRGNIVSTLTTMCDGFLRGDLYRMFSTKTTVTPEATLDGKIIVLDIPTKQFHQLGRVAQIIWKLCWQRVVEEASRDIGSIPVFLWVDEAHHFVTPSDAAFVTTAREQLACAVYVTQSKSNYLSAFGAGRQAAAESFMGVPKTRVFHCNGDTVTNRWASEMISEDWHVQTQHGRSEASPSNTSMASQRSEQSLSNQHSTNSSVTREPLVYPGDFAKLSSGGPPDYLVEAYVFLSGRTFRGTGQPFINVAFQQIADKRKGSQTWWDKIRKKR